MTRLVVTLVGLTVLAACSVAFVVDQPARGQSAATQVTIEAPVEGASTTARSVLVTGAAPFPPDRGDTIVTVTVNARPSEITVPRGRYSAEVALEVGRNLISAKAEVYGRDEDKPSGTTSASVVVTRSPVPGDATGTLDLATAYLVTTYSDDFYWLCGEGDGCSASARCVQAGPRRVDCPSGAKWSGKRSVGCSQVMTVRLRDARLFLGDYRCRGRLLPSPQRFVRRHLYLKGQRFRLDERDAPWSRFEVNEPNRYGVPRFDIVNDGFLP